MVFRTAEMEDDVVSDAPKQEIEEKFVVSSRTTSYLLSGN